MMFANALQIRSYALATGPFASSKPCFQPVRPWLSPVPRAVPGQDGDALGHGHVLPRLRRGTVGGFGDCGEHGGLRQLHRRSTTGSSVGNHHEVNAVEEADRMCGSVCRIESASRRCLEGALFQRLGSHVCRVADWLCGNYQQRAFFSHSLPFLFFLIDLVLPYSQIRMYASDNSHLMPFSASVSSVHVG